MQNIIITLDGYSSCGKSTLAKRLASYYGYKFIDSGAMYRAITLYFLRNTIDWNNTDEVVDALKNIDIEFQYNPEFKQSEIYLNGENVEYVIRDLVIAEKVSEVAAVKEVREFAVALQQSYGIEKGIVMDGRDIGSTVFPNAEVKFFLVADLDVRVQRRFKELYEKNPNITLEEVSSNLAHRDYIDSNREISPLRKPENAIVLNNTNYTKDEFFKMAVDKVNAAVSKLENN